MMRRSCLISPKTAQKLCTSTPLQQLRLQSPSLGSVDAGTLQFIASRISSQGFCLREDVGSSKPD